MWLITILATISCVTAQLSQTNPDCPIPTCTILPPPKTTLDNTKFRVVYTKDQEALIYATNFTSPFNNAQYPLPTLGNHLNRSYTLNYDKVFLNIADSPDMLNLKTSWTVVNNSNLCPLSPSVYRSTSPLQTLTTAEQYCFMTTATLTSAFLYDYTAMKPVGYIRARAEETISFFSIMKTNMVNRPTSPSLSQAHTHTLAAMRTTATGIQAQTFKPQTGFFIVLDASRARAVTNPLDTAIQPKFSPSFIKEVTFDHIFQTTINETARSVTRETTTGYIMNAAKTGALYKASPAYYLFLISSDCRLQQALSVPYDFSLGRFCPASMSCCLNKGYEQYYVNTWLFHYYNLKRLNVLNLESSPVSDHFIQLHRTFNTEHSMHCDGSPYASDTTYNIALLRDTVQFLNGTKTTTPLANEIPQLTDSLGYLKYQPDMVDASDHQNYMAYVTYLMAIFYPTFTEAQKFEFHNLLQSVCYFDKGSISRNQAYHSICHIISFQTTASVPYPIELQIPFTTEPTSGYNAYLVKTPIGSVAIGNQNPFDGEGVCFLTTCIYHPTKKINQKLTIPPVRWQVVPEGIAVVTGIPPNCLGYETYTQGSSFFTIYNDSKPCQPQTMQIAQARSVITTVYSAAQKSDIFVQPYGKSSWVNGSYQFDQFVGGALNLRTLTFTMRKPTQLYVLDPIEGTYIIPDYQTKFPLLTSGTQTYYYDPDQTVTNTTEVSKVTIDFSIRTMITLDPLVFNCEEFICDKDPTCRTQFSSYCQTTQPILAALKDAFEKYNRSIADYTSTIRALTNTTQDLFASATPVRYRRGVEVPLGYGHDLEQPSWVYDLGGTAIVPWIGTAVAVGKLANRVASIEATLYQITQGVKQSIQSTNDKFDKITNILHTHLRPVTEGLVRTNEQLNAFSKQVRDQFTMINTVTTELSAYVDQLQQVFTVGAFYQNQILQVISQLNSLQVYVDTLTSSFTDCISDLNQKILSPACITTHQLLQINKPSDNLGLKNVLTHYINGSAATFYHLTSTKGVYKPLPKLFNNTHFLAPTTAYNPVTGTCFFCGSNACDKSVTVDCDYQPQPLQSTILAVYPTPTGLDLLTITSNKTFEIKHGSTVVTSVAIPPPPILSSTININVTFQQQLLQLQEQVDQLNLQTNYTTTEIQSIIDKYNVEIQNALNQIVDFGPGTPSLALWKVILILIAVVVVIVIIATTIFCSVRKNQSELPLQVLSRLR
ncbi:putative spike protein [White bream virus]|uniref:Spike glycoprotein n=1 Tax=White bream virus (isolate Blicca bjoerkna L./Germany/DF24/00) TaxID=766180 RepID=SPIKE_WBV24|nr:putative spike protein [White bream virus]Q008X4.1 RecName: Full=Spike glycoprotein; Short=S glycoprotein; Flags: Precursor [White bream virus (strain DF24/00)]ABI97395.1 putative spike protein [White bream virus]